MIAFVTSLRHPDNSDSYEEVERLLQRTLHSVTAQTDDDFVVIVVGNQRPSFPLAEAVRFVAVDFPAPAPPTGPHTERAPFVWDKGTKIGVGLLAAREHNPDHVMIFDADDFVSRRLAEFVNQRPKNAAWVVATGLIYSRQRNSWRHINQFNRTCGTCFVIPFATYAVPGGLGPAASQAQVAEAFGERLPRILGAHRDAAEWFANEGLSVEPLPFPGAVYHVDTGENHSGKRLRGIARPLRKAVSEEFGIVTSCATAQTLWQALGPRPICETVSDRMRDQVRERRRRTRQEDAR